jgi:hypothetical protein
VRQAHIVYDIEENDGREEKEEKKRRKIGAVFLDSFTRPVMI